MPRNKTVIIQVRCGSKKSKPFTMTETEFRSYDTSDDRLATTVRREVNYMLHEIDKQ